MAETAAGRTGSRVGITMKKQDAWISPGNRRPPDWSLPVSRGQRPVLTMCPGEVPRSPVGSFPAARPAG